MDMEFSETSRRVRTLLATIHGFRVQSYGKRLSSGFKRGLRRLAERGFDDPTCVVIKTTSGNRSGITHAGGRYVDIGNPHRTEVMRQMRDLGMEPPRPPFILAPGEYALYHEWGHHVFPVDFDDIRPIDLGVHAADAVVLWWHASSELFADLFEDWRREEKKVSWDQCEPKSFNAYEARGHPFIRIAILPGVKAEDVRAETYVLFTAGIRSAVDVPPVRSGLFGPNTDEMVGHLRGVLAGARAERL